MNVQPKAGPNVLQPGAAKAVTPSNDAKARAVAKFMQQPQAQEHPVTNPTQVSPEELTAVSSSSQPTEISSQIDTSVETKAPEPEKPADPLSQHYVQLARKEKALRAKTVAAETALKAREAALVAKEAELKAKEAEYTTNYIPKSRFKQDPLSILNEEGISYDEIASEILNPTKQDPRVMAELARLKAQLDEQKQVQEQAKQSQAEQQKLAYNQALNDIHREAVQLVRTEPEYETIRASGEVREVTKLIERTFKEDGYLMSVEEAAKEVENELFERIMDVNNKVTKIKEKLKSAQASVQTPAASNQEANKPKQQQSPQMKTLTNAVNASKKLSAKERAILAFKGELK